MFSIDDTDKDMLGRLSPPQLADVALFLWDELRRNGNEPDWFPTGRTSLEAIASGTAPSTKELETFEALKEWIHDNGHIPSVEPIYSLLAGTAFWKQFFESSPPDASDTEAAPDADHHWGSLLGLPLRFPFGVPACAVSPNSAYLKVFSSSGFDLLTYKTVRSGPWRSHPHPNLAFVPDPDIAGNEGASEDVVFPRLNPNSIKSAPDATLVNSIGVPATPRNEWTTDVRKTRDALREGQILIVSVAGSVEQSLQSSASVADEVADNARAAFAAGAHIVELNFSSPNNHRGLICADPQVAHEIVTQVRRVVGTEARLLLKTAYLPRGKLQSLFDASASSVNGYVAINAVPVRARDIGSRSEPFFKDRHDGSDVAGLSGAAIRELGVTTTRWLAQMRVAAGLTYDECIIVGTGGVSTSEHYAQYRSAGANAVQSCTGAWFNRNLAFEIKRSPHAALDAAFRRDVQQLHEAGPGGEGRVEAVRESSSSAIEDAQRRLRPEQDMNEFVGEWVVIRDRQVLAHHRDLDTLMSTADVRDSDGLALIPASRATAHLL